MPTKQVRKAHKTARDLAVRINTGQLSLKELSAAQFREILLIVGPALALIAAAIWIASRFVEPAPPRAIAISTGGQTGGYYAFGQKYAAFVKKAGVTLEVRTSAGAGENIKRLLDPASGVQVALVQGGITNQTESPGLVSLGRIFLEPMWVFYRSPDAIDRLAGLKGKRVMVGPEGSGTRVLAATLLKANGVTSETATFLPLSGQAAVDALMKAEADALFFTASVEAPLVQSLMRADGIRLMSLAQAEAYTRHFPYLSRIVLPKGAIDLVRNIPANDVEMVAPVAALVARDDLHPALAGLLAQAAKEVHGKGGMFQRIGEFPRVDDPEFEVSDEAERIYKVGPPFLQRYLPFWIATFLDRMKVMVLPILTILVPLVKVVPALYRWRVRRRILHWYWQLKVLEGSIAEDGGGQASLEHVAEIDRIDSAVRSIPVPVGFTEQYYQLRGAIDLVRSKLNLQLQDDVTPAPA